MWSGSNLKFEHPQQPGGQENEFNPAFHQMRHSQSSTPSTPTHHRRGQSLSAINAPRTPNHLSLRPPVYLQSPMAQSPMAQSPMGANHHNTGLMGVGDVFSQPNGSFHENMGMFRSATHNQFAAKHMLTLPKATTRPLFRRPGPPWITSTRKSQTLTCPTSEARCLVTLCSSLRCPRRVKHPDSLSTIIILSHRLPSRLFPRGQHHHSRTACRYKIQTQVIWTRSSARLSRLPVAIPSGIRSFRMRKLLRLIISTRSETHSCKPGNPPLRTMDSWNLICGHLRLRPRATASPTPAVAAWEIRFEAPQISAHS